jgi:hypothetical protein
MNLSFINFNHSIVLSYERDGKRDDDEKFLIQQKKIKKN